MSRVPCRFYHSLLGNFPPCRDGINCRFSHDPITEEQREQFIKVRYPPSISSPYHRHIVVPDLSIQFFLAHIPCLFVAYSLQRCVMKRSESCKR